MKRHAQGLRLIQLLLKKKSWELLLDNDIADSDFKGDAAVVLKWIRSYENTYEEFPTLELLEEANPTIKMPQEAPEKFVIKQFFDHRLGHQVNDVIVKAQKPLLAGHPQQAYNALQTGFLEIKTPDLIRSFRESGPDRYQEFQDKILRGVEGVLTPWQTYNLAIMCWENGTHNSLLGISNTGKTWMSCVSAHHAAFLQGKKVLLVSLENQISSIETRLDALAYKIAFGDLRAGRVDMRELDAWEEELVKNKTGEGDIFVVDNSRVRTVEDVYQIAVSKKVDFVVIDGAYELTSNLKSSNKYEDSSNVIQSLHLAAKAFKRGPFLSTVQLGDTATDVKSSQKMGFKARGNKEWYISPATVLCILQSDEDRLMDRVTARIAKIREAGDLTGIPDTFYINSDRVRMDFSETDSYLNEDIIEATR